LGRFLPDDHPRNSLWNAARDEGRKKIEDHDDRDPTARAGSLGVKNQQLDISAPGLLGVQEVAQRCRLETDMSANDDTKIIRFDSGKKKVEGESKQASGFQIHNSPSRMPVRKRPARRVTGEVF
jgi:hypothetical protein